jgi:hemoglobin
METKTDIENIDHIKILVDTFYQKVQQDKLLGPIFTGAIRDWPHHLEKMYRFWQTVLLDQHTYSGSPFPPHAHMPIDETHFNRWLQIFHETVDNLFTGKIAGEAKWRSEKMAAMFQHKIAFYRGTSMDPLH